jgi:AraC-like DNA-binding protein
LLQPIVYPQSSKKLIRHKNTIMLVDPEQMKPDTEAITDPAATPIPGDLQIVRKLIESKLYQRFRVAYGDLTGLPLALRSIDYWQPPLLGEKRERLICSYMAQNPKACSCCLETQSRLIELAKEQGQAIKCPMGMIDIAVPIHVSGRCIAFLHTGQMLPKQPSRTLFRNAAKKFKGWNLSMPLQDMEESYRNTEIYTSQQQKALIELITQFAERLSDQANTIMIIAKSTEPLLIKKARRYIKSNITEPIRLENLAKHLNVSPFYLCRQFQKHAKLRFTEYITRLRVERAKQLLLQQNNRISEVAFEAGFQSIPHFNRSFKRVTGSTPTLWRVQ